MMIIKMIPVFTQEEEAELETDQLNVIQQMIKQMLGSTEGLKYLCLINICGLSMWECQRSKAGMRHTNVVCNIEETTQNCFIYE